MNLATTSRDVDPKSSLFGLFGLYQTVTELVTKLAEIGDVNMTDEGARLLEDFDEAMGREPGDVLRTGIGGKLQDFRIRALKKLATGGA